MRFNSKNAFSKVFFPVLLTGGVIILTTIVGCSSNKNDDGASGASGAAAGKGGAGGSNAGTSGKTGTSGTGGTSISTAPVATTQEKQTVCQCLRDVNTLPLDRLIAVCQSNVTNDCVACIKGIAKSSCAGMKASDLDSCSPNCSGVIPAPTTAAECKELVTAGASSDAQKAAGDCLCDACLSTLGPCIVDVACQKIARCGGEQGCGTSCVDNDACAPIFSEAYDLNPNVFDLAIPLGTCADTAGCFP
jgi:hypothetical protein